MVNKVSILYSWFVRTVTIVLPNIPVCMRFRGFLYSFMMQSCGHNFQVSSSALLNSLSGLSVGNDVYIGHNAVIIGLDIHIQDEVMIGPNSVLASGNHLMKNGSFRFGGSCRKGIIIGRGSWVAGNCTLVAGSKLPESSVLGAGAVLKDAFMEGMALYGGVPAKYIGSLSSEESTKVQGSFIR